MNSFFEVLMSTVSTENPIWANLLSYWRLDETTGTSVEDIKGGKTGTASNLVGWVSGKNNNAASFNATTSKISLANNTIYPFERTDSFSTSCWIKRSGSKTGEQMIFTKIHEGGIYNGIQFCFNMNRLMLYLITSYPTMINVNTNNTFTGSTNFYHIVMTYNGSSNASGVKIYVDGVSQTLTVVTNNLNGSILSDGTFTLGNRLSSNGLSGVLDEFGLWNTVLTQSQVTELYNSGNGLFY